MAKKKARKVKKKGTEVEELPGELTGAEINGFPIMRIRASDLDPADYNPRTIKEAALEGLKASVAQFGLTQPIVWNRRTRRVVGGHQRLRTIHPEESTDVLVVDLDEKQEKSLNLALNNRHISGDWTHDLGKILEELRDDELFSRLSFDDLTLDVPKFPDVALPPDEFPEVGEDLETKHECPRCGYAF